MQKEWVRRGKENKWTLVIQNVTWSTCPEEVVVTRKRAARAFEKVYESANEQIVEEGLTN